MGFRDRLVDTALVVGSCVIALLVVPSPGKANTSGWAHGPCSFSGSGTDVSVYKKSQAKSYALVANREGYQWGGGCWNDSDHDNQYGDPVQNSDTHGEGGDCSGFTFKTWALENGYGTNGKQRWSQWRYIHGPYAAVDFKNPPGSPIANIAKSNAYTMEAFASSSHIGMIYNPNTSQGGDIIIEAKCETCGTLRGPRLTEATRPTKVLRGPVGRLSAIPSVFE